MYGLRGILWVNEHTEGQTCCQYFPAGNKATALCKHCKNVIIYLHPCNRGWMKLESPSFQYGCDDFAVSKVSPCRPGHVKALNDGFPEQKA